MELQQRYSDAELEIVIEQSLVYMCACPAQVAESIRNLRRLYRYQKQCLQNAGNDSRVHVEIASSTLRAHETMEDCLDRIIEIEQWDRTTLKMPENLRRKQLKQVQSI